MRKVLLLLGICLAAASFGFADEFGGYRSYKLGDFKFIAIKDLDTNMGKSILLKPSADIVKKLMPDNQNPSTINTFILKMENKTILFDTGTGVGGNMLENLKKAEIAPDDINIIIVTHMHGDHIGGLVSRTGEKVFKNADVYINAIELQYWVDNISIDVGTSNLARTVKTVYGDKINTFEWGDAIIPEIKSIKAAGHTPGHTVFEITSGKEKLMIISDLMHNTKIQTADPSMAVTFDVNANQAIESRKAIFKDVLKRNIRVAGMHIHFPGIGYITEASGGAYFFNPSMK